MVLSPALTMQGSTHHWRGAENHQAGSGSCLQPWTQNTGHGQLLRDCPAGISSSSSVQYPPMNLFSTNLIYLELIYSSALHNILCNKFYESILCSKKRYQLDIGLTFSVW